jgi:hypothetical protein
MISGQNYVFDVQRTWREVYDSTRLMVFSIHDERLEAVVLLILVEWLTIIV